MFIFVIVIITILVILYLIGKNSDTDSQSVQQTDTRSRQPYTIPTATPYTTGNASMSDQIKKLYDSGDVKVQSTPQQKKMVSDVRTYQQRRRKTVNTQNQREQISIDLSWSDNLSELLEATEVVYSNAQMNCNRRLESARFQYYINLHFRSFTAADLCHEKVEQMYPHYNYINSIIKRFNDRSDSLRVSKEEYTQIVQIKDTMKSVISILTLRRDELNQQTGVLRDKIRDECGSGGAAWYQKLMERRNR